MELNKVNGFKDIKNLDSTQLKQVAEEIRAHIISTVQNNGGHLAPSLGTVDAITALAYVYDFSNDKIIFDVGHQAYAYKILTEGKQSFSSLRTQDGISGFTGDGNFEGDLFIGGHAGNSLSLALGCLTARDFKGEDYSVIAFVGDGSFFNGENLEALFATEKKPKKFLVVFNDNGMSISPNQNGAYKFLSKLSLKKGYQKTKSCLRKLFGKNFIGLFLRKIKSKFKRSLNPVAVMDKIGLKYYGVYDGHDMKGLCSILSEIKQSGNSAFLHIRTIKGKGYEPAEKNPEFYHGVSKDFKQSENTFSNSVSQILCNLINKYPTLTAITAGMKLGTGLSDFALNHPKNFIDAGICEQHAVTMAGGMAIGGLKPIVCIYSTFMQRAYDQILVDVCMKNLPVVFLLDRAGLVGSDGRTHQGVFDISFMRAFPNITLLAPKSTNEFALMLDYALSLNSPVAIRYPNGKSEEIETVSEFKELNWEVLKTGEKVVLFAVGPRMISLALKVASDFENLVAVVNCRSVKPLDEKALTEFSEYKIITLEENAVLSGFGESVNAYYSGCDKGTQVLNLGVPDTFISHASVEVQLEKCGLCESAIKKAVQNLLKN